MKKLVMSVVAAGSVCGAQAAEKGSFGYDAEFVAKHTKAVVLKRGDAKVLLAPDYQGRVMTSTAGGDAGPSYGWLNYPVIEKGVLKPEEAKGKLEEHIYVFGGEERFWLGPEGGQFAIYFAPGAEFSFDNWHTPAAIDTMAYDVKSASDSEVVFTKKFELLNRFGTKFVCGVERTIRLMDEKAVGSAFGISPAGLTWVAYESDNKLTNLGEKDWVQQSGLLSIWLLGMYKPTPGTTVVVPVKEGPEAKLGPVVNDSYFGKVPPEYLRVEPGAIFFKGDGTRRGKIGVTAARSKGIAGSYDADSKTLNLVSYNVQAAPAGYVNSMWEIQKDPYSGDVINSYNDGSPGEGKPPLGPFYEIETSSPAAMSKAGASSRHVSRTLHVQGPEAKLDAIAKKLLGVGLKDITGAFKN